MAVFFILFYIIFIPMFIVVAVNNSRVRNPKNKEDDISSLDGAAYLIRDDNAYVMYKLKTAWNSKYIRKWEFTPVSDTEGTICFGDLNYTTLGRGNNDFGHTFQITLEPAENKTIMHLRYIGNKQFFGKNSRPTKLLTESYHFFFKEQFDVEKLYPPMQKH
ncbi:hypothetical protein SAMN06296386_10850 [Lachnospiraceae bacterium]|nr:hypothetical protein SAMN06296386_10850 [Lachnospiraceae bacterium]